MADIKTYNQQLIADFRADRERGEIPLNGRPILLLTTTGAKSGLRRTTPLMYIADGERLLIIASNAGAPNHPDWYRNLVANPVVSVEIGKESFDTQAVVLDGAEREQTWAEIVAKHHFFADHATKTSRRIPVVALKRSH